MRTTRLSSGTDPALRPVKVSRPARPPILLMAGLSFLLILTGCASKENERSPDDNRASQRAPSAQSQATSTPIDWAKVAEALGKSGAIQPGNVYKVGMPRG